MTNNHPTNPKLPLTRVRLPANLRALASLPSEVMLTVPPPVTVSSLLTALEQKHPALLGTLRDQATHARRPLVRFFACNEDISQDPTDTPLPDAIATGVEPLLIIGAIAGG